MVEGNQLDMGSFWLCLEHCEVFFSHYSLSLPVADGDEESNANGIRREDCYSSPGTVG